MGTKIGYSTDKRKIAVFHLEGPMQNSSRLTVCIGADEGVYCTLSNGQPLAISSLQMKTDIPAFREGSDIAVLDDVRAAIGSGLARISREETTPKLLEN